MGLITDAIDGALGRGLAVEIPAEAPAVKIKELTGRKRSVELRGRMLPSRQPEWSGRQRSAVTWYPGNPEGTQQIFGPAEDDTTLTGYWHEKYLVVGTTSNVKVKGFADPLDLPGLIKIFNELRISGQTIQVQWSFLKRVGVLKRFAVRPDRVEDMSWTMEFEWFGDGTPAPAVFGLPFDLNKIKSAMNDLSDLMAFDPIDTLQAFEAALFNLINEIQGKVDEFLAQASTLAGAATLPLRVVQGMRSAAMSIAFSIGSLLQQLAEAPYILAQTTDQLSPVYLAEVFRRDAAFLGGVMRDSVLSASRNIESRAEPTPLRIVTMDQSGSLRVLAQREYGNADAWTTIADANGFESSRVAPGTQVYIPPAPGVSGVN